MNTIPSMPGINIQYGTVTSEAKIPFNLLLILLTSFILKGMTDLYKDIVKACTGNDNELKALLFAILNDRFNFFRCFISRLLDIISEHNFANHIRYRTVREG